MIKANPIIRDLLLSLKQKNNNKVVRYHLKILIEYFKWYLPALLLFFSFMGKRESIIIVFAQSKIIYRLYINYSFVNYLSNIKNTNNKFGWNLSPFLPRIFMNLKKKYIYLYENYIKFLFLNHIESIIYN